MARYGTKVRSKYDREIEAALRFARALGRNNKLVLEKFQCVHAMGANRGAEWFAADVNGAGYVTAWRTWNIESDRQEVANSCFCGKTFHGTLWGFSIRVPFDVSNIK